MGSARDTVCYRHGSRFHFALILARSLEVDHDAYVRSCTIYKHANRQRRPPHAVECLPGRYPHSISSFTPLENVFLPGAWMNARQLPHVRWYFPS